MSASGHPVSRSLATGTDYKRRIGSAVQEFSHRFVIEPLRANFDIAVAEYRDAPTQTMAKIAVYIRAGINIDTGDCNIRPGFQTQPVDQFIQFAMHFIAQVTFFPAVQRQGFHVNRVTPAASQDSLSSVCQTSAYP